MRSDIADFGLGDALPAPHAATLALAMLPTRLARLDGEVQERVINWGYAACRRRAARARRPARCPRPAATPIPPPGSAREARAQAAGAVGLRPGPAAPLHAGLAGHARRLDGLRRRRSRRPARPPARAPSRGGRGRAGARAAAQPAHRRAAGHAARLQPVARRGRADLRGARARCAADVALVARGAVAARHRRRGPGAHRAAARDHRRPREPDARAGPARGRRRAAGRADLVRRHRRAHRVGAAARPRATPSPPTTSRRPASATS